MLCSITNIQWYNYKKPTSRIPSSKLEGRNTPSSFVFPQKFVPPMKLEMFNTTIPWREGNGIDSPSHSKMTLFSKFLYVLKIILDFLFSYIVSIELKFLLLTIELLVFLLLNQLPTAKHSIRHVVFSSRTFPRFILSFFSFVMKIKGNFGINSNPEIIVHDTSFLHFVPEAEQ